MAEPTPTDLVRELRRAVGLFDGAMAISPEAAWQEALVEVHRLRSYHARIEALESMVARHEAAFRVMEMGARIDGDVGDSGVNSVQNEGST